MSKAPSPLLFITLVFPNSPKYAKDRSSLLKKLKSWIREEKGSLPIQKSKFERNTVILSREEMFWRANFRKPISTILAIRDPEKNMELANAFGNKVLNYLKTILGKFASDAKISTEIQNYPLKMESLARKVIGETRLAKINEITKKTFDPLGVLFHYKKDERDILFMLAGKRDDQILFILSDFSFKDTIPWDAVLSEYNEIMECKQVITGLLEQEI